MSLRPIAGTFCAGSGSEPAAGPLKTGHSAGRWPWQWSVLAWWVGIGWQCAQPALWSQATYVVMVVTAVFWGAGSVWAGHRFPAQRGVRWGLVLSMALLAAGSTGWRAVERLQRQLLPELEGVPLRVQGVVEGLVQDVPAREGVARRFVLKVHSAWQGENAVTVPERLELTWWPVAAQAAAPDVQTGTTWALTVRLRRPDGLRNPHLWDYEKWLWTRGVGATGSVEGPAQAHQQLRPASVSSWDAVRAQVHQRMPRDGALWGQDAQSAQTTSPDALEVTRAERSRGLVVALLTGDQRAIKSEDWQRFRHTGIVHLFSVSGLHVTMFAWVMMAVVQRLWRQSAWLCRRWPAPVAGLQWGWLAALLYALFSGWGVPAQRTVFMLGMWVALRTLGMRWPWWMTWSVAGAFILAADPWAWWQPGFWLSFVAVGLLMMTSWPLYVRRDGRWPWLLAFAREQWVLLLALTPWLLWWFGEWSTVSWLMNALAIPWVTLVLTPLSFAGMLWPALWEAAAWSAWALLWLIEPLADWSHAVWYFAVPPWWASAAAVLGGGLLACPAPWSLRLAGLALAGPALLWRAPVPPPGHVELWALDVGQGSAVVVRTTRHVMVYDTGPRYGPRSDAGARVLVPWLRSMGWVPDQIVLSHSDSDHAGGASTLRQAWPQAQWMGPMTHWDALALQPCKAGTQWQWDAVTFRVWHPQQVRAGEKAANADSCVIQILVPSHYKGAKVQHPFSAWLTGDLEASQERALLHAVAQTPVAWMLASHHGSAGGSSVAWVQASRPDLVVVQAGHRNRYGHPAPSVVARWESHGASVLTTAKCGALRWRSWEPSRWDCERERHRGYWQSR